MMVQNPSAYFFQFQATDQARLVPFKELIDNNNSEMPASYEEK